MSYEKQTWNTGDIITAEKLNHIEDGISESGSGGDSPVYIITDMGDRNGYTLYKTTGTGYEAVTYGEIMNKSIMASMGGEVNTVFLCSQQQDSSIIFTGSGSTLIDNDYAAIFSAFGTGTASDTVSNLSIRSATWTVTPAIP